jgi:ATP-dependent Clp protease ATP-binding subunit ClpA
LEKKTLTQFISCTRKGVTRLDVVNFIAHGIAKVSDGDSEGKKDGAEIDESVDAKSGAADSALDTYATNLNELAVEGKIDPLIGRDSELERVVQILCRRRKNNPLLVGEAGVGKTAIAEGLARRIVEGEIPENIRSSGGIFVGYGCLARGYQIPRRF